MTLKELIEYKKKSYIMNFNGIYRREGTLKRILGNLDYFVYPCINSHFYEAIKEAIKYIIVNKDKYNMDSEDLNNSLKCYNLYNNLDIVLRTNNISKNLDYVRKLETITDKIEFDFEGKHYSYKLLKE